MFANSVFDDVPGGRLKLNRTHSGLLNTDYVAGLPCVW